MPSSGYMDGSGSSGSSASGVGLRIHLRFDLVEMLACHRPFLPDELSVGLHVGLILDGLRDGMLLHHHVRLRDNELRLCVHHVETRSRRQLRLRLVQR